MTFDVFYRVWIPAVETNWTECLLPEENVLEMEAPIHSPRYITSTQPLQTDAFPSNQTAWSPLKTGAWWRRIWLTTIPTLKRDRLNNQDHAISPRKAYPPLVALLARFLHGQHPKQTSSSSEHFYSTTIQGGNTRRSNRERNQAISASICLRTNFKRTGQYLCTRGGEMKGGWHAECSL